MKLNAQITIWIHSGAPQRLFELPQAFKIAITAIYLQITLIGSVLLTFVKFGILKKWKIFQNKRIPALRNFYFSVTPR
jgi:hypothetical protein